MSEYRGRSSRGRSSRGRGGPRGGFRGRGGYSSEFRGRGSYRGRGDGFSRGRGGPPRHSSRDDDSPPRKVPMMSRGFDSDRGRGPPLSKSRRDRFDDDFERGLPSRSRDLYSSPPRESSRLLDRLSPLRSSLRDRDFGSGSRDFLLSPRLSLSGDSGSFREAFSSSLREDRRENLGRPRDFISPRSSGDYIGEKSSRDFRDSTRDYGSRDYPRSSDFREPLRRDSSPRDRSAQHGSSTDRSYNTERSHNSDREFSSRGGRGGHMGRHSSDLLDSRDHHHNGDRDFSSSRFPKLDDRSSGRGPPREFKSHSGRGGMRDGRDDHGSRGGYMDSFQGLEFVCVIQETGDALIFEQHSDLQLAAEPVKHEEVYLIIHHDKTTIFTDVLEGTTVNEVKKMIEGILKLDPKNMMLYRNDELLAEGDLPVSSYGLTSTTANCFSPANLRIVLTEE